MNIGTFKTVTIIILCYYLAEYVYRTVLYFKDYSTMTCVKNSVVSEHHNTFSDRKCRSLTIYLTVNVVY